MPLHPRPAPIAVAAWHRLLDADPRHVPALNALGNLAVAAKDYDRAISFHQRAVKAEPKNPVLRNDLGNSLILAGLPQDAIAHLEKALAINPKLKQALFNLARAYRNLDKPEAALAVLDRIANIDGTSGAALALERATILAQMGRTEKAVSFYREVLKATPNDVRAIAGLANSRPASPDDNALPLIQSALTVPSLSKLHRSVLHQTAGKVLEDLGRYSEAFAEYERANVSAGTFFDMASHLNFVESSKRLFSTAFFAERPGFGVTSGKPIFIVGLPRSGTTLVEQVLASHPAVAGLGEARNIQRGLVATADKPFGADAFFAAIARLSKSDCRNAANAYLDNMGQRAGKAARFTDKMPHNFLVLGWIALLFPKATIIHCTRDAMDVCASCYTHTFSESHSYSNDQQMLGKYYLSHEDLMQHWKAVLPMPITEVSYEDIVANLEKVSRRLLSELGLEWNEACLAFHKNNRVVQTPSQWQVHQPIYQTSIGRWRRFENKLGPLKESLQRG